MRDIRCDVVRRLVTEHRYTNDGAKRKILFGQILERVDKLLISKVIECSKRHRQLDGIDRQELYNTAVVGLHRAITTARDTDSGSNIQARIINYVREEIRKTYLGRKRRILTIDPASIRDLIQTETNEFDEIECKEIVSRIIKMVENGEISREDFNMLLDNAVNGNSYTEIGRKKGMQYTTVSNRIKKIKKILVEKFG